MKYPLNFTVQIRINSNPTNSTNSSLAVRAAGEAVLLQRRHLDALRLGVGPVHLLGDPVAGDALRLDDAPGGHGLLLDATLLLRVDLGALDRLGLDLAPAHLFKRSGRVARLSLWVNEYSIKLVPNW